MADEFGVEEIVGKRKKTNGRVEYFIKWKGFSSDENTWETRQDLISDGLKTDIDRWEADHNTTTKRTSRHRRASKTPLRTQTRRRSKTPVKTPVKTPGVRKLQTSPKQKASSANPKPKSIDFTAESIKENPLIWSCFALAVITTIAHACAVSDPTSKALWQLRPFPSLLTLVAVWFGMGTRTHHTKFLALGLVWHTAGELLLAMIDAREGGCSPEKCKDWALVALIITHLALAYGNKKPSKASDSSVGLAGSIMLCASTMMLVLEILTATDIPNMSTFRYLISSASVLLLSFSAAS